VSGDVERLAEDERAVLLTPCVCGHDLNDHGELAGCWACPEDNRECSVSFETLLTQHMATILDARSAAHDAEVAARALREAADQLDRDGIKRLRRAGITTWLRARADWVAGGEGK
jgi:hypothetical protein